MGGGRLRELVARRELTVYDYVIYSHSVDTLKAPMLNQPDITWFCSFGGSFHFQALKII